MEVKEPKQYSKCRVVSKSTKKDGAPYVKVSYDGWGREYDDCLRNAEFPNTENDMGFFSRFPA